MSRLSVIIPTYNEERCLPQTLEATRQALAQLPGPSEIIVVDNNSQDDTKRIALAAGALVAFENEHNIARVRNTGARAASGDLLVFIDADTVVPAQLFRKIAAALDDPRCAGGAVAVRYDETGRRWMRWYLGGWAFWGSVFGMAQGAAQFCRRPVFDALGGYDETIYMGEDVDFYWRLRKRARVTHGTVTFIAAPPVVTSGRRFGAMSLWKTLLLTHPVFIRLMWRRRSWWADWYERTIR